MPNQSTIYSWLSKVSFLALEAAGGWEQSLLLADHWSMQWLSATKDKDQVSVYKIDCMVEPYKG